MNRDFAEMLSALSAAGAEFLIVGAHALAAHGILRVARTRTSVGIEIYNSLNSSATLAYNPTFVSGGTWLRPNAILTPRFVKLSAQFDF